MSILGLPSIGLSPLTANGFAQAPAAGGLPTVPFGTPITSVNPAANGASLLGTGGLFQRFSTMLRSAAGQLGFAHAPAPVKAKQVLAKTATPRRGAVARPTPRPAPGRVTPQPAVSLSPSQLAAMGVPAAYGANGATSYPVGALQGLAGTGLTGAFDAANPNGPQLNATNQNNAGAPGTQSVVNRNSLDSFGNQVGYGAWSPDIYSGYGYGMPYDGFGPSMTGRWYAGSDGGISGFFRRLLG